MIEIIYNSQEYFKLLRNFLITVDILRNLVRLMSGCFIPPIVSIIYTLFTGLESYVPQPCGPMYM